MKDQEHGATGDSLAVDTVPPFQFDGVDPDLASRIQEAVNAMGAVGDDAEQIYQRALGNLTDESERVVEAVARELAVMAEDTYLDRWALIQLLAELQDPASLPVLDDFLSRPMTAERFPNTHGRSTRRRETIVLATAIEAIRRIAGTGDETAVELLQKHATHEGLTVRRAAIQGYLEYGGDQARDRLVEALPKEDHYLLDIRRIDVREAPPVRAQPGPTRRRQAPTVPDAPRVEPKLGRTSGRAQARLKGPPRGDRPG